MASRHRAGAWDAILGRAGQSWNEATRPDDARGRRYDSSPRRPACGARGPDWTESRRCIRARAGRAHAGRNRSRHHARFANTAPLYSIASQSRDCADGLLGELASHMPKWLVVAACLHLDPDHPPLPCVSIHSPCDGVVDESSAVIPQYIIDQSDNSAPRENLRVLVIACRHVRQSLGAARDRRQAGAGSRQLGAIRPLSSTSRKISKLSFHGLYPGSQQLGGIKGHHDARGDRVMTTSGRSRLPAAIVTLTDEHRYMKLLVDDAR